MKRRAAAGQDVASVLAARVVRLEEALQKIANLKGAPPAVVEIACRALGVKRA